LQFIQAAFEKSCDEAVRDAPAPHRVRRELAEIRDKRLQLAQTSANTIADVLNETYETKIREILQRCVAAQLLRPQALETAYAEIQAHYSDFGRTRDELRFLTALVELFRREKIDSK